MCVSFQMVFDNGKKKSTIYRPIDDSNVQPVNNFFLTIEYIIETNLFIIIINVTTRHNIIHLCNYIEQLFSRSRLISLCIFSLCFPKKTSLCCTNNFDTVH